VTLTPDSKSAYVANAQSNSVSVIDIKSLKEVTELPWTGSEAEHHGFASLGIIPHLAVG
jgi:YVTN family beta-propeller protein